MRRGAVYYNDQLAGYLTELDQNSYIFRYEDSYFSNSKFPEISLTLPKTQKEFNSSYLFPFFYNMLSEGVNKKMQTRQFKLDEDDAFGLLLKTAELDTIGAVSVKRVVG